MNRKYYFNSANLQIPHTLDMYEVCSQEFKNVLASNVKDGELLEFVLSNVLIVASCNDDFFFKVDSAGIKSHGKNHSNFAQTSHYNFL